MILNFPQKQQPQQPLIPMNNDELWKGALL